MFFNRIGSNKININSKDHYCLKFFSSKLTPLENKRLNLYDNFFDALDTFVGCEASKHIPKSRKRMKCEHGEISIRKIKYIEKWNNRKTIVYMDVLENRKSI